MTDYIDREALLKAISKVGGSPLSEWDTAGVVSLVANQPAADVAPVVHGKWVHPHWNSSNYCYDCSVCGREAMHQEYKWGDKKIYPICPNCGAKMEARNG
mgnify:CR=1 FL=1